MPDLAIASAPTPLAADHKKATAPAAPSVPEVFDGYHVWRQFHSRTKNRPFWHCTETSQTRWERPAEGAVQAADRVPVDNINGSDDLTDGAVDETANRRAFLQALYEWRGGKAPAEEASVEADAKQSRAPTQPAASSAKPMVPLAAMKSASRAKQAVSLHSASGNGEAGVVLDMLLAGAGACLPINAKPPPFPLDPFLPPAS